jgi:hypothetical protein
MHHLAYLIDFYHHKLYLNAFFLLIYLFFIEFFKTEAFATF